MDDLLCTAMCGCAGARMAVECTFVPSCSKCSADNQRGSLTARERAEQFASEERAFDNALREERHADEFGY